MAYTGGHASSAPASPAHTHLNLPPPPLRGVLKRSRPPTPTGQSVQLSPLSSPFIGRVPLSLPDEDPTFYELTPASSIMHPPTQTASTSMPSMDESSAGSHSPPRSHVPRHSVSSPIIHHLLQAYTPKVSFDTFENPSATMFSFTLQVKSEGYKRTRSTRVFLCAASPDESGSEALDWCLEALVQDGDELIVFRGVDEEVLDKDHDVLRAEARELMRLVQEKGHECDPDRKLSLVLEYIPGKITDSLDRLIALYRPDSVVVGTRGRRSWQGMGMIGMGSISKYCLSHSPVPVIVVRPERKVKKTVEKRKADPKRGRHFE
ncbi:Universal stress protein A family protein C25B2.10 [Leucoagaricus sp. SymC.cos]|nr:Universal stress protein A family protein C25B2.10 [Leucoagaricus sp. SymC.cos]